MVEIPNGLMFQGIDKSWYASFPTNDGSYILKHQNGDWQMYRNEPYLRKTYAENLTDAHDKIAELYTTLIASAMGGFAEAGMATTSLREGGRVFWSGGPLAKDAATIFARMTYGTTLEMTRAGQNLAKLTKDMHWEQARPIWERLSTVYATRSKGFCILLPGINVNPGGIWI
jgi:hypothetical protein